MEGGRGRAYTFFDREGALTLQGGHEISINFNLTFELVVELLPLRKIRHVKILKKEGPLTSFFRTTPLVTATKKDYYRKS